MKYIVVEQVPDIKGKMGEADCVALKEKQSGAVYDNAMEAFIVAHAMNKAYGDHMHVFAVKAYEEAKA